MISARGYNTDISLDKRSKFNDVVYHHMYANEFGFEEKLRTSLLIRCMLS